VGFGRQVDYQSAALEETSGGYNCWWPMPFHKSAHWTITNMSKKTIHGFYWNIDFDAYHHLPPHMLEFHALWRQESPVLAGHNYVILSTTGRGQYVGTALFMQAARNRSLGFLEGNEMVYIDDKTTGRQLYQGIGPPKPGMIMPRIEGTGTEDYFLSGWYFDKGPYSAPYHGCLIKQRGRVSAYRWHIQDPILFKKSILMTIQVGAEDNFPADYSSVAYWYQTQPHPVYPPLPDAAALLPHPRPPIFAIPDAIPGVSLIRGAKPSTGKVVNQNMQGFGTAWSGGSQLWWTGASRGSELVLRVPAVKEGKYRLIGYFTKARDYGTFQLYHRGKAFGPEINCYSPNVVATGAVSFGVLALHPGANKITVRMVGKSRKSIDYFFGLNAFVLRAVH
jgi:hypothetical protein